ncbi:MAG: dihydrodipicolinate synthase family protein [Actinobacteria bacterium]|nr:dihydrodipicolinate synthase family protein [Actinomycetota bacterium]
MTPFQQRIRGVIPAILTPLNADFTVDAAALRRLVRRVIDGGCHGFVTLGTTGEFAQIDDDQRSVAIRSAVAESAGAVPVIVGAGQPNVRRVREQLKIAGDLGADGALVNPPFYFPMTPDEVVRLFEELVKASPIPILLYNIPSMTKVAVNAATLKRLRDAGVQGTKDSTGDANNLNTYCHVMRDDPDFRVIVGGDRFFLHALLSGACATTGLTPNLAPYLDLDIYTAYQAGRWDAAAAAQNRCNEFLQTFLPLGEYGMAVAKAVLSKLGVMQKWVAPPKTSLGDPDVERVFAALRPFLPEFAAVPAGR